MQITAQGVSLYYEQYGQGSDVLLMHGWGCSVKHFEPIAKELSQHYRVTVLDFPAHGQSGRPPEPWGVPEFAACFIEFLSKLGIQSTHIIGHSNGGRIALYMAATYPKAVRSMVLTGASGIKKPQTEEPKKKSAAFQHKKQLLQGLTHIPLAGGLAQTALKTLQKKYGSADYNALDDEMKKTFVKIINLDLKPLLPGIAAPTLLVWGEKDTETPLWMGQQMEQNIPDAGLVVFEGDDHYAYLRQWKRFCTIVEAFLK